MQIQIIVDCLHETDDWTDPEVWKKANPSLGITVGMDKVEAAHESAKQNPGEENSFRQLRLNQWVKQAVAGCYEADTGTKAGPQRSSSTPLDDG